MGAPLIASSMALAFGQMSDPRFRSVAFLGIGLTFGALIVLSILFSLGLSLLLPEPLVSWGNLQAAWWEYVLGLLGLIFGLAIASIFLVPVTSAFVGLFLDRVAQAVEDVHYPGLGPVKTGTFMDQLVGAINFLGVLIAANIIAFLASLIFPLLSPLIFLATNGSLLGREYFGLVAARHMSREDMKRLRRSNRWTLTLAGMLMAFLLIIPLINLVVPIFGVATFAHLFHKMSFADRGVEI